MTPSLQSAGWDQDPHRINEQVTFTNGLIIVAGRLVSANLDPKNPNSKNDIEHRPLEEFVAGILEKEHRIIESVERIKALLEKPL